MGSTAGKKKRREEKREGAPQVNSPKPDDIRRNGRRRCRHTMPGNGHTERPDDIRQNGHRRGSKKEQAKRKKEQGKRKKEQAKRKKEQGKRK